ncbi:hypothetical protein KI387_028409, partial [Taxus chinensis]
NHCANVMHAQAFMIKNSLSCEPSTRTHEADNPEGLEGPLESNWMFFGIEDFCVINQAAEDIKKLRSQVADNKRYKKKILESGAQVIPLITQVDPHKKKELDKASCNKSAQIPIQEAP